MRFVKLLVAAALLFGCEKPVSESPSTQASLLSKSVSSRNAVSSPISEGSSAPKVSPLKPVKSTSTSVAGTNHKTSAVEVSSPPSRTTSSVFSPEASEPYSSEASEASAQPAEGSVLKGSSVSAQLVSSSVASSTSVGAPEEASSAEAPSIISEAVAAEPEVSSVSVASVAASSSSLSSSVPSKEEAAAVSALPVKLDGWMHIDFLSRDKSSGGGPAVDTYRMDLTAAGALRAHGAITRKPRVVTAILGREKSPLELIFDVNFELIHPEKNDRLDAGKMSGNVSISREGVYQLSGGKGALTISSKVAREKGGLGGAFAGSIKGKPEESAGLLREYTRWIGGRKVSYRAQHTDPLEFKNLTLAAGPIELYPEVSVSGRLDYDYDTGNWLTDGILMRYRSGDSIVSDKITGTIKWEEDPDRAKNGRGKYVFNLRFNEDKPKKAQDESDFFASVSDEEAFFIVDENVPTLSGSVSYKDRVSGSSDSGELTVLDSRITYDLSGNGLNKQQLVNFFKLWLLLSGPVNDE